MSYEAPKTADQRPRRLDVVPATAERWPDVDTIFGGPGAHHCWCMAYRLSGGDPRTKTFDGRREHLRLLTAGEPPPGMLAYLDGKPAGWLGFGPRPELHRLAHSRTIPVVDDRPVWSIVCFLIRTGYRRRGVAKALLEGIIDYARRSGAPGLEAYPVDPEGARIDTAFGYVGFTSMFETAGFERVLLSDAHSNRRPRWLVRLMFEGGAGPLDVDGHSPSEGRGDAPASHRPEDG
jgi:GNAT superfamily N-acetyltransferase